MTPAENSLSRFSDRVKDYIKYRPSYPKALLDFMEKNLGLGPSTQIADVGSGTGIFTQLLLERGASVFAVEPNSEMRHAAEELLGKNPRFKSIAAPAESTTLPSHSCDLVTAAQAFHWFDVAKVKLEWKRILKPSGKVALIWNDRKDSATPFLRDYENLLQSYGTDYKEVKHRNTEETGALERFFSSYEIFQCENEQIFDFEGLKGRLLSSSYAPAPGHSQHEPMMKALRKIFDSHHDEGWVRFEYETKMFYGQP